MKHALHSDKARVEANQASQRARLRCREQLVVCVGWQTNCQCYEAGRSVGRCTTNVSLNPLAALSLDHSFFSEQEYKPVPKLVGSIQEAQ